VSFPLDERMCGHTIDEAYLNSAMTLSFTIFSLLLSCYLEFNKVFVYVVIANLSHPVILGQPELLSSASLQILMRVQ
jgi:hypothetical protein